MRKGSATRYTNFNYVKASALTVLNIKTGVFEMAVFIAANTKSRKTRFHNHIHNLRQSQIFRFSLSKIDLNFPPKIRFRSGSKKYFFVFFCFVSFLLSFNLQFRSGLASDNLASEIRRKTQNFHICNICFDWNSYQVMPLT